MKIYRMTHRSDAWKSIQVANTLIEEVLNNQKSLEAADGAKCSWIEDKTNLEGFANAPFIFDSIPVVDTHAYNVLEPFMMGIKRSIISVAGEEYYILFSERPDPNLLDEKESSIRRFSNGRIMDIKRYVFKTDKVPALFGITQRPYYLFATDDVVNAIREAGLTGFDFEECHIANTH